MRLRSKTLKGEVEVAWKKSGEHPRGNQACLALLEDQWVRLGTILPCGRLEVVCRGHGRADHRSVRGPCLFPCHIGRRLHETLVSAEAAQRE